MSTNHAPVHVKTSLQTIKMKVEPPNSGLSITEPWRFFRVLQDESGVEYEEEISDTASYIIDSYFEDQNDELANRKQVLQIHFSIKGSESSDWRFFGKGFEFYELHGNCLCEVKTEVTGLNKNGILTITNVGNYLELDKTTAENSDFPLHAIPENTPGEQPKRIMSFRVALERVGASVGSVEQGHIYFSQDPSVGIIRGPAPEVI